MAQLHRRVLGLSDRGQLAPTQTAGARSKVGALAVVLLLGSGISIALMVSRRRAIAMRMTFPGFPAAFLRATKPARKPA